MWLWIFEYILMHHFNEDDKLETHITIQINLLYVNFELTRT